MGATDENLKTAFAGESQANRRYLAFAKKAEQDGFRQVARLFRAAAEAETVHAMKHMKVLGLGPTKDNLKVAIDGETYEFTKMYPSFIEQAQKENRRDAEMSFKGANEVEKAHASLYKKALQAVETGKDLGKTDYYICQGCGFTAEGRAPPKCPVCGSSPDMFNPVA